MRDLQLLMSASAQWSETAACSTVSADLFFDRDGETREEREIRERAAKAVCAQCPALDICLDFAIDRPGIHGLWGGMNGRERAAERRRRSRSVVAA